MRKFNNKSNISGNLIKQIREDKGISKEDLCKQLQLLGINIDRVHLYRIENGRVILKDFELIAICKILNINMDQLLPNLNI